MPLPLPLPGPPSRCLGLVVKAASATASSTTRRRPAGATGTVTLRACGTVQVASAYGASASGGVAWLHVQVPQPLAQAEPIQPSHCPGRATVSGTGTSSESPASDSEPEPSSTSAVGAATAAAIRVYYAVGRSIARRIAGPSARRPDAGGPAGGAGRGPGRLGYPAATASTSATGSESLVRSRASHRRSKRSAC